LGEVMRRAEIAAITARQDQWMQRASAATVAAFDNLIGPNTGPDTNAVIRSNVPVGRLTVSEKGWICASVVWAWIAARAEQAASEGWNAEHAIRTTGLTPDPWSEGAVITILPKLFEALPDFDWQQPVGAWSKSEIAEFLMTAFGLMRRAFAARDLSEAEITGVTDANRKARQINAAAGNPRMTVSEFEEFNSGK
jgi:hypothetical protein